MTAAEVVFTATATSEEAQTFYRVQKQQVIKAGRNPDRVLILPGVIPIVSRTLEEARGTWRGLNSLMNIDNDIRQLSTRLNMGLSVSPLDRPVPDVPAGGGNRSRVKLLTDLVYHENLILHKLAVIIAGSRGHRVLVGTASVTADDFQHWLEEDGADGFSIMPAVMPE